MAQAQVIRIEDAGVSIKDQILTLHNEIKALHESMCEKSIRVGELLTEQKKCLPHGEFTKWVRLNCPFSPRTAREYMWVYCHRDKVADTAGFEKVSLTAAKKEIYRQIALSRNPNIPPEERIFIRFSLTKEGAEIVEHALTLAGEIYEKTSDSQSLIELCLDWTNDMIEVMSQNKKMAETKPAPARSETGIDRHGYI